MTYPNSPVSPGSTQQYPNPQQYPPQQYPAGPMTAAPVKKSNTGLIIGLVVGIFAVLCIGGGVAAALAGDPDATTPSSSQPDSAAQADPSKGTDGEKAEGGDEEKGPKTYKVGQTVRGGDFEFVVHGTKCGIAQVGSEYLNKKAQGSYCRVDVTAKNVTKKAHYFHADGTVTAKDSSGREFDADGEANLYGNKDGAGFLDEINPGNQVRAFVYFDVPKGAKLTTITFDAGLFTLAEDAVVTL